MHIENLYITPIIKVVGDYCNNRCGYCFYHNLDQKLPRKMSNDVLEMFIRQYAEVVNGPLSFVWHGGEPLLAGLDFFREIIRLQDFIISKERSIRNSIQTNGTLITDEWAVFFKENRFGVGVSLDGDKEDHNRFRINHTGCGTFDNTVRGIKILQKYGIKPSIIQTVTKANVNHASKNFKFFVEEIGLDSFGINPYLDLSESNKSMNGQSLSNDSLTELLVGYTNLWLERDDKSLRVREIDSHLSGLFDKRARNCTFNDSCRAFCSIDYDGKVFPCDRLSGDHNFCLGTLTEKPLKEIFFSEKWRDFACKTQELPEDCTSCEWKHSCNNGCTAHRVGGINGKYYFCQSRRDIFSYLRNAVR